MENIDLDTIKRDCKSILNSMSKIVIGYGLELKIMIAAMLANGHILLEGVPGIAKTTIARGFAKLLGLPIGEEKIKIGSIPFRGFSRIQFTPDLMPTDITGSLIWNPHEKTFQPYFGPIFSYLVLADEINRATPRTQSALLEAMQERRVSIGGFSYPLELRSKGKWFIVIATQNPIEQEGTYPLPEAQLDRFAVRIIMDYPGSLEEEKNIYKLHSMRLVEPVEDVEPVTDSGWLVRVQEVIARNVRVGEDILNVITRIIRGTRPEIIEPVKKYFELGASPRAGIMLLRVAKAYAAINGKEVVELEDVKNVLFSVLNHRVIPNIETVIERGGRFRDRVDVIKEGLEYVLKTVT